MVPNIFKKEVRVLMKIISIKDKKDFLPQDLSKGIKLLDYLKDAGLKPSRKQIALDYFKGSPMKVSLLGGNTLIHSVKSDKVIVLKTSNEYLLIEMMNNHDGTIEELISSLTL